MYSNKLGNFVSSTEKQQFFRYQHKEKYQFKFYYGRFIYNIINISLQFIITPDELILRYTFDSNIFYDKYFAANNV